MEHAESGSKTHSRHTEENQHIKAPELYSLQQMKHLFNIEDQEYK